MSKFYISSKQLYPNEAEYISTAFKVWRNRLKENACDMFIPLGWAVDMPYRDLNAVRGLDKHNKFTVAEVDQWLDLQYTNDPENSTTQIVSAKKPDPQHGVYTYMDTTLKLI